jgi:hypothetical protein
MEKRTDSFDESVMIDHVMQPLSDQAGHFTTGFGNIRLDVGAAAKSGCAMCR